MAIKRVPIAPEDYAARRDLDLALERLVDAEAAYLRCQLLYQQQLILYAANAARIETPSVRLLTVRQVAERLGQHEGTVLRKVLDGNIPSLKLGKSRRVDEAELEEWVRFQSESTERNGVQKASRRRRPEN